jgi:hypothetical protein
MIFKYFRGDFKFRIEHGRNKNIFEICSQELIIFAKLLSTNCHYPVPYLYKINKKIIKFWDYACYLYFLLISEVSYFLKGTTILCEWEEDGKNYILDVASKNYIE